MMGGTRAQQNGISNQMQAQIALRIAGSKEPATKGHVTSAYKLKMGAA